MNDVDELDVLREAWEQPEPPSPSARASARAALMWRAAGGPAGHPIPRQRWRLRGRLAFGTAAVTVAAVTAAVMVAVTQLPYPGDSTPGSGIGALSAGQEILLAAATTAQQQPAETGGYWYVEAEHDFSDLDGVPNPQILEKWTADDGRAWTRNACCPDLYETDVRGAGFQVGGSLLTLEQLQELPTAGEQLTAWIRDSFTDAGQKPPDTEVGVAFTLVALLYRVPAPPEVRAGAFRALATMPEVTSLGTIDGGEGLRIALEPPAADKFRTALSRREPSASRWLSTRRPRSCSAGPTTSEPPGSLRRSGPIKARPSSSNPRSSMIMVRKWLRWQPLPHHDHGGAVARMC